MKPTFKNQERSGPYKSFQPRTAAINLNKKKVGWIAEEVSGYRIWFHLKAETHAGFTNIKIAFKAENMAAAKEFVRTNWNKITSTYDLHQIG